MKLQRSLLFVMVALVLSGGAALAPAPALATPPPKPSPDLWDLLRKTPYRASWQRMLKGEARVAPWLLRFGKTGDGPVSPGHPVRIGNKEFLVVDVCQTHNCDGSFMHVLFSPGGGQAWALFRSNGLSGPARWFGKPGEEQMAALRRAEGAGW